ncbi:MAG: hypothetical protein WC005_07385 [Candidatus Nanopelagicales bacterium]
MSTPDSATTFSVFAFLFLVGLAITFFVGSKAKVVAPSLASYLVHVSLSMFLYIYLGLSALGSDGYNYQLFAEYIADTFAGRPSTVNYAEGKEGWLYALGGIYFIFGKIPAAGLVIVSILMGALPAIMASTSRMMGWAKSARAAAWLSVMLPTLIIWPSSILREGPAIFVLSIIVLSVGLYHSGRSLRAGVLLVLATFAMMWIRPPVGIAVLAGIAVAVILVPTRRSRGWAGAMLFLTLPALALPLGLIRGTEFDLGTVATLRENLAIGATTSTGATSEGWDSPSGAALSILRDLPGATFGPFPWQALSQPWQLTIDGAAFIVLAFLVFIAVRTRSTRRAALTLVFPAVAVLIIVAATFGNYGFVVRQRSQAAPFLVPVAAAGWVLMRQRRSGLPDSLDRDQKEDANA